MCILNVQYHQRAPSFQERVGTITKLYPQKDLFRIVYDQEMQVNYWLSLLFIALGCRF